MNKYHETVEAAKRYVDSNIESAVSPENVAKEVRYSLKQLNRIFSMATGITIGEYIRWSKLAKSLFELKYSDKPIIDIALKFGYESQESYTRAFKDNFSLNPGEYRKTRHPVIAKNWHINQFIHQSAHSALSKGLYTCRNVDNWIVVKPDRLWVSARKNTKNLHPSKFYSLPGDDLLERAFTLPNVISGGGAYFPSVDYGGLSFGVEVAADYPPDLLNGFEMVHVPQSKYIVFNYPKYPMENHGDAIYSTWNAQKNCDISEQGLKWAFDKMPIFEDDHEEMGYTLWFPACDLDS